MEDGYVTQAGRIEAILPDGRFRVILDNNLHILASIAVRMRRFRLGSTIGDRVQVEMSAKGATSGRIVVPGQSGLELRQDGPSERGKLAIGDDGLTSGDCFGRNDGLRRFAAPSSLSRSQATERVNSGRSF